MITGILGLITVSMAVVFSVRCYRAAFPARYAVFSALSGAAGTFLLGGSAEASVIASTAFLTVSWTAAVSSQR